MKILIIIAIIINCSPIFADDVILNCDVNSQFFKDNLRVEEHNKLEAFTKEYIKRNKLLNQHEYIIPVVFHVVGEDFSGTDVTVEKIINSLNQVNDDFNGRNEDYETSDPYFDEVKSKLKIRFLLAKLDPEGNPTNGINFYSEPVSGLANDDTQINNYIKSISWDNNSYMNVYITSDLFDDGVTSHSGYAYYPSMSMTNQGLARVVYNGRYLTGNTSYKFASILTHEFGHWLNLLHTFEGGCAYPNDHVEDTPPVDNQNMPCPANNCEDEAINSENFMDYTYMCYCMFTNGQVERMKAALETASRFPLWQYDNLVKVGLESESSVKNIDNTINIFPNPADRELINISKTNSKLIINQILFFDTFGREIELNENLSSFEYLDLSGLSNGFYYLNIYTNKGIITKKLIINKK